MLLALWWLVLEKILMAVLIIDNLTFFLLYINVFPVLIVIKQHS
jgi:hypothetical protein